MTDKGLFQRVVLGMLLAVGFLVVWMVAGIVAFQTGTMIVWKDYANEILSFRGDGTALILHFQDSHVTHYRDLSGVPAAIPEGDAIGWLNGTQLPASLPEQEEDGDWEQRVRYFKDAHARLVGWYFVTEGRPEGTAYFVGYDSHSKARLGYLGTAGFSTELPPPQERFPFAGATEGARKRVFCPGQEDRPRRAMASRKGQDSLTPCTVYVLGLDRTVYEADLCKRTVRVAFRERGLRSLAEIDDPRDSANSSWRLAVRTDTAIIVLDKHGTEQQRYPIPEERREQSLAFGETSTGEAVMYWSQERTVMDTEAVYRVFWMRPDGGSRAASVTLPHDSAGRSLAYFAAAVIPAPLVLKIVGVVRSRELHEEGLAPTFAAALARTLTEFWPALAIAQLLAAGLALLCYRRQVRYGVGRMDRIIWPLFVLMLGVPGWIGYRFSRKWPVLEGCADCGAAVPRDRANCVRCASDFPRPALKGTEVFA